MKMNSDFASQQEKHFDTISTLQGKGGLLKQNRALSLELETIMAAMGNLQNKKVLDIGCGNGRHALRIARFAREVVGIDISKKSIDLANQIAREMGINNFTGLAGNYSDPIRNKYFDYALMVNVIHHIDDIGVVLRSAKASLKESGQIIILEFNPLNVLFVPFLVFHQQTKVHFNTKYFRSNLFSLKKYLRNNGFKIVSVDKYAFLPTLLYNYSPLFETINSALNAIPVVNKFCAFHIIKCGVSS